MKRYEIEFEYHDMYCRGDRWNRQTGFFSADNEAEAVRQCIKFYGLGVDCRYRILSVREK